MRIGSTFWMGALLLTLAACGGDAPDGDAGTGSKGDGSRRSSKKDRGEASMTMGGAAWQASSARVRRTDEVLTIRAAAMKKVGDVMQRDELHLAISDFDGPGDYTVAMSGSRFIRVGIDMAKTRAATESKDEDAVTKEAVKALTGSNFTLLIGAKITITAVSDTEVSGTFSWASPADESKAIPGGSFRAVFRK